MNEKPAFTGPGSDGAPTKGADTAPKAQSQFKIADVRATDVTLELDDGRVFVARVGDNIKQEDLKRGRLVSITNDGMDSSDAPKNAVVNRLLPKD